MRGDIVFHVFGVHDGRSEDQFFRTFRTREEAEAEVKRLEVMEMHGSNWAARYHSKGFVIREHAVDTDFEIPPQPKPRDRYYAITQDHVIMQGTPPLPAEWPTGSIAVFRRDKDGGSSQVCTYGRNYSTGQEFEPFRQGDRDFALISRSYTQAAVLDLASGTIIAEEPHSQWGFCPYGFYVPDWWDVNTGNSFPGSLHWGKEDEWPTGSFGFVWGCVWGDDVGFKVQYLDLRFIRDGVIRRDDRFGYVRLDTGGYQSPCINPTSEPTTPSAAPSFISVASDEGIPYVRFSVEMEFDLTSGIVDKDHVASLRQSPAPARGNEEGDE